MEDSEEVYAQYELVAKDLENGVTNQGVWAKAFADSNGDERATTALYMQLMVERALQERARADKPKVREYADQKSAPQASVIDDQIASQPESQSKFEWSSIPWLDRFAMIMLGSGIGAFIAATVTTLAMGMRLELSEILFARTTGPIYLAAFIGFFVLLIRGYFRRSSQSPAKTEKSYTQGAETFAQKEKAASADQRPSNKSEMALHGPQMSKQAGTGIDPGIYVLAGFLFVVLVVAIFIYVQHSKSPSSNASQSADNVPKFLPGTNRDFDLNEDSSGFPLWKELIEMNRSGAHYSTRARKLRNSATSGKPFVQFAWTTQDVRKRPFDNDSRYLGFIHRQMIWTRTYAPSEYYVLVPNPSSEPIKEFTIELSTSNCRKTDLEKNYFRVRGVDISPGSVVAVRFQSPKTSTAKNANCLIITSLNGGKLSKISWTANAARLR